MTTIPNKFLPDTVIKSDEINENFDTLANLLAAASGSDSATYAKDFIFGKRANMLLSGAADSGSAESLKFLQLGWNTNFVNQGGGTWKLVRFNSGDPATFLRIGKTGLEVWTTSQSTGNLDTQAAVGFAVHANSSGGADYIYIPGGWNIQNNETADPSLEEIRTTLTWLDEPLSISSKVALSRGSTTVDVYDAGISQFAKAVIVNVVAKGSTSECTYRIYQERTARVTSYGGIFNIPAGKWSGGQVSVALGRAGNAGKIVFDRSENIAEQTIVVLGYYS